mgnify:CR=1 FL=1
MRPQLHSFITILRWRSHAAQRFMQRKPYSVQLSITLTLIKRLLLDFLMMVFLIDLFFFKGDSGGPIMSYRDDQWHLVGVVSNGDAVCTGKGIYTNVAHYYGWLMRNMNLDY